MEPYLSIEEVAADIVWPVRHQVMYPDKKFDDIKLSEDASGIHFALFQGEELVSVVSLFRTGDNLQFRKFATFDKYQRQGFGSRLLRHVIDWAKQHRINRMWCNARKSAAPFYEKFGMYQTNTEYTRDGISFIIMEMIL